MSNSLNIKWLAVMATYIYNMITKRLILILLLLIPSLMSYSKQGSDRLLRLQVNVFGRDWTFPQDTVTQKIILEFIEDAQLAEDEFLEVRARGKKEYSIRLSQEKSNWLRQWILENVSVPIKVVAVGVADHDPLVENPQTDYERDLNMFVDIRVVRE
ncbi:MAG: hypothetical protein VZQ98_06605 [Bacteroidales bacterium]|nr:hypothetical protein [Bacteroidales bacterium]